MVNENSDELLINLHIRFLQKFVKHAPQSFATFEPTKPTILFFLISGLDLLNALDDTLDSKQKADICDWIYELQVEPKCGFENDANEIIKCGFYGSRTLNFKGCDKQISSEYNVAHLAITYSCLSTLVILGDDLNRVNKAAILNAVKRLQNKNGSFLSSIISGENDMRFVYCAIVICYILDDFSYINISGTVEFILNSVHYDGGISLEPNLESHGGSSFCGLATLSLMGQLELALTENQLKRLQRWLICRQDSGFQGRPHKQVDTCYSFWIGAALKIIGIFPFINCEENRKSILNCQNTAIGGFSKYMYTPVDLLHTYFGLYGLSLMNEAGLQEMHPALNMSLRAYQHLKKLHTVWKTTANS